MARFVFLSSSIALPVTPLLLCITCLTSLLKGTVIQIEKALINDRLRVSKVPWEFRIPTIYNFAVIYP